MSFAILWIVLGALVLALTWVPAGGIAFLVENGVWQSNKLRWEKRQLQVRLGWLYLIGVLLFLLAMIPLAGFLLLVFLLMDAVIGSVLSFCKGGWPALKAHQAKTAKELSEDL